MNVRVSVNIQLPGGSKGMPGMEQVQQQLTQLQNIPGLENLEELVGGKLEGLGGGTAAQFFQNLARQASAQQGGQRSSLGMDDQQLQGLGNNNNSGGNPLAKNSLATPSRIGNNNNIDSQLADLAEAGGGGGYFEDKIFAIMCKIVEDMQKKVEERLQKLQAEAKEAESAKEGGGEDKGGESRNIEFEKIKFDMQKLSQMQQAMSNVLNTMDELAKSAIRNIKV